MTVDPCMLEAVVRSHLNLSAPRTMVVLDPLPVTLTNLTSGVSADITVPDFPDAPDRGSHPIAFGRVVYIEREDFREEAGDDKGYRRLMPGQPVGLKYADCVLRVTKVIKGDGGKVTGLEAEAVPTEKADKPKAFIHWVAK